MAAFKVQQKLKLRRKTDREKARKRERKSSSVLLGLSWKVSCKKFYAVYFIS